MKRRGEQGVEGQRDILPESITKPEKKAGSLGGRGHCEQCEGGWDKGTICKGREGG